MSFVGPVAVAAGDAGGEAAVVADESTDAPVPHAAARNEAMSKNAALLSFFDTPRASPVVVCRHYTLKR